MIAVNGIPINQLEKDDPALKFYQEALDAIKAMGREKFVLKWHPDKIIKADPADPKARDENPGEESFKSIQRFANDKLKGELEFRYYTTFTGTEGNRNWQPRYVTFKDTQIKDVKRDMDMIFFMIIVSPYCSIVEPLKEYQNEIRAATSLYILEDKQAEMAKLADYERTVHKAKGLFWDEESGMSDEQVAEIGKKYDIAGFEDMSSDEKRTVLSMAVLKQSAGKYNLKTLKDFIAKVAKKGGADKKQNVEDLVDQAKEKGFLVKEKDEETGVYSWKLLAPDAEAEVIAEFEGKPGLKHDAPLIDAVGSDDSLRKKIQELV